MKACVMLYQNACISAQVGKPHYEGDPSCSPDCPHVRQSGKPPTEWDRSRTQLPVCPYCGYADREWWDAGEWGHNERSHSCPKCEKEYKAYMEPNPEFTTYPIEEEAKP